MAAGDYRSCDVCGGKAFYDADLSYEDMTNQSAKDRGAVPMRYAGQGQYSSPEMNEKYGQALGYVGDWAVICTDCSPKFKTVIVPIENTKGEDHARD